MAAEEFGVGETRYSKAQEDLKDAMKNPSDYLGYCELMDWEAAHRHIKSEKKRHKLLQEKRAGSLSMRIIIIEL